MENNHTLFNIKDTELVKSIVSSVADMLDREVLPCIMAGSFFGSDNPDPEVSLLYGDFIRVLSEANRLTDMEYDNSLTFEEKCIVLSNSVLEVIREAEDLVSRTQEMKKSA